MAKQLSQEDLRILTVIDTLAKQEGIPPSRAEISEAAQRSSNTIAYHLYRLRDEFGAITWTPKKCRSIRITNRALLRGVGRGNGKQRE